MRICITGDVLYQNPISDLCKKEEGYDYIQCLKPALAYMQNSDYLIVNPETSFAGEELGYTAERYSFNTPEAALAQLKEIGVGLVTLANNHIMDRDYAGLLATIKNCEKAGIDYIGISNKERKGVVIKELGDLKIGFVNATYGTNAFAHHNLLPKDKKLSAVAMTQPEEDLEGAVHLLESNEAIAKETEALYKCGDGASAPFLKALKTDIEYAKQNSDFVIMLLHSGGQYNAEAEAYTKMLCERIKKMGADIIVTNHPHIILPCEFDENGIFTAYCLGNLQSAFPHDANVSRVNREYSALLYLDFNCDKKYPDIAFSIMRCIASKDKPPMVYNAYDYFKLMGDKQTEKEMIAFANRFMPNMNYISAQKEYKIRRF